MAKVTFLKSPAGEIFRTENPEIFSALGCLTLTKSAGELAYQDQAVSAVRAAVGEKMRVGVEVLEVSRDGLSRRMAFTVNFRSIDHLIEPLGIFKKSKKGGFLITGAGVNMYFHAVYCISKFVFPNPVLSKEACETGNAGYNLSYGVVQSGGSFSNSLRANRDRDANFSLAN